MTNKEYIKAIEMRTSRRTYKPRALDKSIVEVLKNMVNAVNEASGLEFQFIEDGNPPFKYLQANFHTLPYAVKIPKKHELRVAIGANQ